jgi:hypothetical protein
VAPARISVALATFNGERFLDAQLDSLAAQRRLPHELVIRDDGSTDATLEIVEAFKARSPFPVRVLPPDGRLGFADSFLEVASRCEGELVAFCDQDDVWLPGKLERCAAAFDTPGVVLAVHTSRVVREDLSDTGLLAPPVGRSRVTPPLAGNRWARVLGMSMVFSRELLLPTWRIRPRSHRPGATSVRHDEWILVLARVLGSVAWIDEALALYRQHGTNAVGAPANSLRGRVRELRLAGLSYYRSRADQAADCAELLDRLAAEERDAAVAARLAGGARSYRSFADLLERRVRLYDPEVSAPARLQTLLALVRASAYRTRDKDGFGPRSFIKDAAVACFGWSR